MRIKGNEKNNQEESRVDEVRSTMICTGMAVGFEELLLEQEKGWRT